MGLVAKCLLLVGAAAALFLAFSLNSPVPQGFSEPWKLRVAMAPLRIYRNIAVPVLRYFYGVEQEMKEFDKFMHSTLPVGDAQYDNIQVKDLVFDGVPVRLYKPNTIGSAGSAGIVYIHGGGWVIGSIEMYDQSCRWLSSSTGMVVISVGYRLAPKHLFPAAFHDCEKATLHFIQHADEYEVDPKRIAVMGDSAGGNLAAAVSLRLRDIQMKPALKAQILIYPFLQAIDFQTPSYYLEDSLLDKDLMVDFLLLYALGDVTYTEALKRNNHTTRAVREKYGAYVNPQDLPPEFLPVDYKPAEVDYEAVELWGKLEKIFLNPYFAPGTANDLKKLPKAYVITVDIDPLRDDGILYAQRMSKAGNDVTHKHFKSTHHGLYTTPIYEETFEIRANILEFIKKNL